MWVRPPYHVLAGSIDGDVPGNERLGDVRFDSYPASLQTTDGTNQASAVINPCWLGLLTGDPDSYGARKEPSLTFDGEVVCACACDVVVACQLAMLEVRVRFPLGALF